MADCDLCGRWNQCTCDRCDDCGELEWECTCLRWPCGRVMGPAQCQCETCNKPDDGPDDGVHSTEAVRKAMRKRLRDIERTERDLEREKKRIKRDLERQSGGR